VPRAVPTKENTTGIILAGGRGNRMGGADKGLIPFGDGLMIDHVIVALRSQVAHIVISANRNLERYRALGYPVVADDMPDDYAGPLAGIAAGLSRIETDFALSVPCDAPLLPRDLVARMSKVFIDDRQIVVAHDGIRTQQAFLLMPRSIETPLRQHLREGVRKIEHWINHYSLGYADFRDCPDAFLNVNSPDDKQQAEATSSRHPVLTA
jgi:molybdopterin-guanine dinucleotide biosynthesis protein A